MKKSGDEVINDLYPIIRDSGLMEQVNGKLYRNGTQRSLNSDKEDVILTFKAGLDGQIQDGAAVVNIYVPDIDSGAGGKTKNILRTSEISRIACEIFDNKVIDEYKFRLGNMINTFHEENINQHFVSVDVRFRRTTF